ncbi:MAG: hypothetical protein WKF79_00160 [Nocardioides sp.]
MKDSTTIPGHVLGLDADAVEIDFTFSPGCEAKTYGLPEDCHPAEAPEIEDLTATLDGAAMVLTQEQDNAVVEWIFANHEFAEDEGPDPDYWRDQRADDRLTGHDR